MPLDSRIIKPLFKSGDLVRTITNDGTPTGGIDFKITTCLVMERNPNPKDKIWWFSPESRMWWRQSNLTKVDRWHSTRIFV